jgi:hypothetical protein
MPPHCCVDVEQRAIGVEYEGGVAHSKFVHHYRSGRKTRGLDAASGLNNSSRSAVDGAGQSVFHCAAQIWDFT